MDRHAAAIYREKQLLHSAVADMADDLVDPLLGRAVRSRILRQIFAMYLRRQQHSGMFAGAITVKRIGRKPAAEHLSLALF